MRVPLPFSRIDVRFGGPLNINDELSLESSVDTFIVAIKQLSSNNDA